MGLHMNPDNNWVKLADRIPWDEFKAKEYLAFAKSKKHTAKKNYIALHKQLAYVKRDFWYFE